MKAPAFQWYAAEYLADERVAQLSLESEAVYVRLLSYCWREGTIPANPAQCAPLCKYADVKVIKPALALFTKAGAATGRLVHKRLEEERAKQEAFRAKQSEKGAKGGRPRKNEENPEKAAVKPEETHGFNPVKPDESSSASSSTSSASTADAVPHEATAAAPEALKANPAKQAAVAHTDPEDEQHWSTGPLTKPLPFKLICERLGFLEIDFEHYRRQALVAAEDADISRTINQWSSWIRNYLNNQMKAGPLLKAAAVDLTRATPRHELPPEGTDCTGRHIVLSNTGDANMNRVAAMTYARYYPNATILHTR